MTQVPVNMPQMRKIHYCEICWKELNSKVENIYVHRDGFKCEECTMKSKESPEMQQIREIVETLDSLRSALHEAHYGGEVDLKYLERTTLLEFIAMMAPNGIRFTYIGEKD